ncbi:50S ribosomal protein L13, chloroplastic [Rhodamnia argentea]|uniref:Large ribosomal subunit protein uL13c n=1 Tax=Rhodamnia argentea TaxID=178133 RepID=A0A8B8N2H4_9MYRT|nr:50S ribosomal protein L13, chloroplastic [Rhodamnia argentea]
MAILCASSSSPAIFASPKCNPSLSPLSSRRSVAGPSFALTKPVATTVSNRNFAVRCQKDLSVVPLDQRWMFEESEVDGPDIWNNTWYPKAGDHVNTEKPWYIVDATDKILGRLASTIAIHIRGKNLATYTPSVDMGAFVIVVNAEKVAVSGKKRTQKLYRRHSGRPGGMKVETFSQLQQRIPERIIEHAVRGMLPKGRLGRALFNHLKVYKGPEHPHEAQKPIELPIRDKRIQKQR